MNRRLRAGVAVCSIALPVLILSTIGLDRSPAYLERDEVMSALEAHSIAAEGHDLDGRHLPLYFHAYDNVWLQPILIYATALWLKFVPLSQASIRAPSTLVGVINVVLMYLVARQLFNREIPAMIAAGALGLAPAHFIHSRLALDGLYPLPFTLAWLLSVAMFMKSPKRRWLFAGGLSLGIGVYSHPASVVMMPVNLLLTCILLYRHQERLTLMGILALGFALPLCLLGVWLVKNPATYLDTVGVYGIHQAHFKDPVGGMRAFFNWHTLTGRVTTYWDYFDPMFLFVRSRATLVHSTQRAGVFLLPAAVFLPAGIYALVTSADRRISRILLLGFATAPLAASLIDERYAIGRAMGMLPFAVLITTCGVMFFLSAPRRSWRVCGLCLLLLAPVQFGAFLTDYFTGYRVRSSAAFGHSIGEVLSHVPSVLHEQ